eukprot:403340025
MDLLDKTPITTQDIPKLSALCVGSFVFFWITYYVSYAVMSLWKSNKIYQELSHEKKADYVSRIVANIHAVISTTLAFMIIFCTCDKGISFIVSDECLMHPSKFHSYVMVLSCGYLIYDTLVCFFLIKDKSGIMLQTYIHHILGLIGGFGSVFAGYCNTPISSSSLITEISTPFVNYRQIILTQKKADSPWYTINSLLFAGSFFVFRILFYPITIWRLYIGVNLLRTPEFAHVESWKLTITYILATLYVSMYFLQIFWFKKILALVTRAVSRKPTGTARPPKDRKNE